MLERNDESYKWLRKQKCKKKEGRKGWRIEGKTRAQAEKEKRICEERGVEESKQGAPRMVNEDERWATNPGK